MCTTSFLLLFESEFFFEVSVATLDSLIAMATDESVAVLFLSPVATKRNSVKSKPSHEKLAVSSSAVTVWNNCHSLDPPPAN